MAKYTINRPTPPQPLGPVTLKLKADIFMTTNANTNVAAGAGGFMTTHANTNTGAGGFTMTGGNSTRVTFTVAEVEVAPGVEAGAALPPRAVVFPGLVVRA